MNTTSKARLSKVHPALAQKIVQLSDSLFTQNVDIEVVQGLRTYAEQDALFAQGRTKPGKRVTNARAGQSNHNFGLAVDVAPAKRGKIDWDDEDGFDAIGREGKRLGLEWGGDWRTFVDRPHLQLPSPAIKELRRLYDKGGLPEVWKSVKPGAADKEAVLTAIENGITAHNGDKTRDDGAQTNETVSGAVNEPEAKEVKMSQMSKKSQTLTWTMVGSALLLAIKEAWTAAKEETISAGKYAIEHLPQTLLILGLAALGIWIYNQAMKRKDQRTNKIIDIAADKTKNDVVIT